MSSDILDQAALAAKQRNWSLVNQCLQQLPLGQEEARGKKHRGALNNEEPVSPDLEQVLNLALEVLEAGDFNERWEVAKVIPKLGRAAIAPLIAILEDEDAEMESRWYAGRILAEFNDPAAIAALVNLLKADTDEELAGMAAAALGNLGSPAVEALTQLLADEDTRLLAVRSLSAIRSSQTIAPLMSVVRDQNVAVRAAAIEALGSFHDAQIPPVLEDALKDPAAAVRKEAAIALGVRSDLLETIDLVSHLAPLLFDLNLEVCQQAAIALGRLGTDQACAALFKVLQSPNTPVSLQIDIVRALARSQTATALEYLQQSLNFESVAVWQEIVTVLGRVEQPSLVPLASYILIDALSCGHPATQHSSVKQALSVGLGQLGQPGALQPLIQMLADPDAGVKFHAIAALKKFPDARGQLEQLAADENLTPALKQGVALALQELVVNS